MLSQSDLSGTMYRDIEAKKTTFADDCIPSRSLCFFRLKSSQILTTDDSPVAAVGMPNKGILPPPPFCIYKRLTSSLLQPLQGLHREVSQDTSYPFPFLSGSTPLRDLHQDPSGIPPETPKGSHPTLLRDPIGDSSGVSIGIPRGSSWTDNISLSY